MKFGIERNTKKCRLSRKWKKKKRNRKEKKRSKKEKKEKKTERKNIYAKTCTAKTEKRKLKNA